MSLICCVCLQAAVQEAQLREANLELERQKALERRLQDEMRAKEEHAIAIEEQFSNVQEEVKADNAS